MNRRRQLRDDVPADPLAEIRRLLALPMAPIQRSTRSADAASETGVTLPRSVTLAMAGQYKNEYDAGASLYRVATAHETSPITVRACIQALGGLIRTVGRGKGKTSEGYARLNKLTDELREYVLRADEDGIRHSVIAGQVGVTKERVRQLCAKAGHPTRRERLALRRQQTSLKRVARGEGQLAQSRSMTKEAKLAALLWKDGHEMAVLAQKFNRTKGSMSVCICRWRALWPLQFPFRTKR